MEIENHLRFFLGIQRFYVRNTVRCPYRELLKRWSPSKHMPNNVLFLNVTTYFLIWFFLSLKSPMLLQYSKNSLSISARSYRKDSALLYCKFEKTVTKAREEFSNFVHLHNDWFFLLIENGKDRSAEQKEKWYCELKNIFESTFILNGRTSSF